MQKIGCVEEIAEPEGYIDREQLLRLAALDQKSDYGEYLRRVAAED
jgi:dTDP-glucose pyrophosphorylase